MSNVSDLTIEVLKGIRADLADLKAEVAGVRDEVAGVRDEVAGVKEEVAGVRSELKAEIRELREDMNAGFVATHQRIDGSSRSPACITSSSRVACGASRTT